MNCKDPFQNIKLLTKDLLGVEEIKLSVKSRKKIEILNFKEITYQKFNLYF